MKLLISIEKKKYLSIIKCSNRKKPVIRAPAAGNSGLSRESGMSVYTTYNKLRIVNVSIFKIQTPDLCFTCGASMEELVGNEPAFDHYSFTTT